MCDLRVLGVTGALVKRRDNSRSIVSEEIPSCKSMATLKRKINKKDCPAKGWKHTMLVASVYCTSFP